MTSMIDLDREFENDIMTDETIPHAEYIAAWEVYNSQPLFGGSIQITIKHIDSALKIAKDELIVAWLINYKHVMLSKLES